MKLSCVVAAITAAALAVAAAASSAFAQAPEQHFRLAALRKLPEKPSWETVLTRRPEDEGIAGAKLGIQDNTTTGRFLKQEFTLAETVVGETEDPLPVFEKLVADGATYIILDVPADDLLRIADAAKGKDVVLLNAGATDDRLRGVDCRDNVLHVVPSRSMLTDALAQYFVTKRWLNWFLIVGQRPEDKLYAEAVKRSARKFGAKIVAEKVWDFGADSRDTAQTQVTLFTQEVSYDVAFIADEIGEFGDLILYRTWEPRLTAGTQGLTAQSWHPTQEAWGGNQLQNRFVKLAGRPMRALDYQFWAAARVIGDAASRIRSDEVAKVRAFIRSGDFNLSAFKGAPLSFRDWDWQLRQPVPLATAAGVIGMSPQTGFLHQVTPLDTLGVDRPETQCKL